MLENLKKWLVPKIQWTVIMLGMLGITYVAITLIEKTLGGSPPSSPEYLYKTYPEKCYCHDCGYEIDMRVHGLYGKHCREIKCPRCGSSNVWRKPR